MSVSPSSLLARLDQLKKWQEIQQEKLLKQHARRLQEVDENPTNLPEFPGNSRENALEANSNDSPEEQAQKEQVKPEQQVVEHVSKVKILENVQITNANKPKRPFLKRGTGLARYKLGPGDQLKSNQHRISFTKAPSVSVSNCATNHVITPLKRPEAAIKPKATWVNVVQANSSACNEQMERKLISQINDLALSGLPSNSTDSSPATSESSLRGVSSDDDDENQDGETTLQPGEQTLYEQAMEKELKIFEDLEQRAMNSSFSSTNSSIVKLLESTPKQKTCRRKLPLVEEPCRNDQDFATISKDLYDRIRGADGLNLRQLIEANLHRLPLEDILEEDSKMSHSHSQFDDQVEWEESDTNSNPNSNSNLNLETRRLVETASQTDVAKTKCDCENALKAKMKKLDEEIDSFRSENAKVRNMKRDLEEQERTLSKDRRKLELELQEERIQQEFALEEERKKLKKEKTVFERYAKNAQNNPTKKERQEITTLKLEVENLKETLKLKETRNATTQARLRNQLKALEKNNANLKDEFDKVSKLNAKLQANQLTARKPSDTKMLHQINKNLTKLAQNKSKRADVTEKTSKIKPIEDASSASSSSDSEDSLRAETLPTRSRRKSAGDYNAKSKHSSEKTKNSSDIRKNSLDLTTHSLDRRKNSLSRSRSRSSLDRSKSSLNGSRNSLEVEESSLYGTNLRKTDEITHKTPPTSLRLRRDVQNDRKPANTEDLEKNYEKIFGEFELPQQRLSNSSLNDTTQKNGKVEKTLSNGATEVKYPNGNVKTVTPDGNTITVKYYNGDIKETRLLDGTIRYYYKENETWHTSYADGTEILEFSDGQTEKRYPNGSVEVQFQTGVIRYLEKNGFERITYPDGTIVTTSANGEKIMLLPNGQKEIHTDEHKRREYPDGTVKILYPDGLQETRYSNGRVRLKDKNGRLLMDSHDGS